MSKFKYCPLCGQKWDKHTEKEFLQSEKELWYNAIKKIVRKHCEDTSKVNYEELGLDIAMFFNYDPE